jgi:unsaturated chondroitin disaccharide hydrolase
MPAAVLSLDVRVDSRSALAIKLPSGDLRVSRRSGGAAAMNVGGRSYALAPREGWPRNGWHHLEATSSRLAVDGQPFAFGLGRGGAIGLRLLRGHAAVENLIISSVGDRGALLLHRLAELHARIPVGEFPVGADRHNLIVDGSTIWTNGFWPGALWQAAAAVRSGRALFERWALAATVAHFGQERSDTHDVGFMYGQSSLAAWRALCHGRRVSRSLCPRLKHSALSAADELLALSAGNRAGTIPVDSHGPDADTIVDSMMNIAILPWGSRVTGDRRYQRLASVQAHTVARLLVRRDGSSAQSVHFDRVSGRVLFVHTHQGLSNSSTWARGQAWGVYGFAQAAADLHDRALLSVAVRMASYVARHLAGGGVPRWDYDAPAGAPVDVSAGVITAAGLLHLVSACQSLPGVCSRPAHWVSLAKRMLRSALRYASSKPPLGYLGGQVLNERGTGCWCNGTELIFGLSYALEGLRLEGVPT